jgi:hypothetical protein
MSNAVGKFLAVPPTEQLVPRIELYPALRFNILTGLRRETLSCVTSGFKTLLSPESVALSYSIDGEANVTLQIEAKRSPIEAEIIFANGTIVKGFSIQSPFIITSSTNLPELNEGMHNITVYAEYRANNIVGLDNATVYFTILGMRQPPASNYTEISEGTVEACENPQSTSSTFFPNHNSCSAQNEPTPKPRSESPSHQTASPQTEFIDLATATLTAVAVAVTVMLAKKQSLPRRIARVTNRRPSDPARRR